MCFVDFLLAMMDGNGRFLRFASRDSMVYSGVFSGLSTCSLAFLATRQRGKPRAALGQKAKKQELQLGSYQKATPNQKITQDYLRKPSNLNKKQQN